MNRINKTERLDSIDKTLSNPVMPQTIGLDRLEYYTFVDENGKQKVTTKQRNNIEKTKKLPRKMYN